MNAPARTARCRRLSFRSDERGAAIVEFAIIFPVLIVLLFGVIDFGRAFFVRNNLIAAAREGARAGAVYTNPCTDATILAALRARVRNYLVPLGGTPPTDGQIIVTTPGACAGGVATNVNVQILNYTFTPITPVFRLINRAAPIQITVSAAYRWEQSPVP